MHVSVEDVVAQTPELLNKVDCLTEQAERTNQTAIDIGLDIAALKELIKNAREEANLVCKLL